MPSKTTALHVAMIGFGEASKAFCKGWKSENFSDIKAYDIKCHQKNTRDALRADFAASEIIGCTSVADCIAGAGAIFSLVTADQALVAGEETAKAITKGSFYFDCNSCAPDTKRKTAVIIENAGGRYVDVAVMAPVHPLLHKVPMLVCGPHAEEAVAVLAGLNMSAKYIEGDIGKASSIKMIRSTMVKGLEALVAECVLAGRNAGVEDIVLDTLDKSYPGFNWRQRSAYMLERMMVHGTRRAAEMREVALTVEQLGLDNSMSKAITQWQQSIGELGLAPGENNYADRADAILAALKKNK